MKWLTPILLTCLAAAATAEHRGITPEDVAFTGRVTAISDSDALLAGSIQLDDPVDGSFQLVRPGSTEIRLVIPDGATPPTIEEVDYGTRCGDFDIAVGGALAVDGAGTDIAITDFTAGEGTDAYSARATGRADRAPPDLPFSVQAEFLLQDAAGDAAQRDLGLPLPGDLADWDGGTVTIVGCAFGSSLCPDSAPRFEIEAVVDTLTTARSDTCLVTEEFAFTGEARFKKMDALLATDTTPATVDSLLVRSDQSVRLRIDPLTELVGQATRITLGTSKQKWRFEIASESEPALLAYIESQLMAVGSAIVPDALDKPAELKWLRPYSDPESMLELEAAFLFQDAGKTRKGVFRLEVTESP